MMMVISTCLLSFELPPSVTPQDGILINIVWIMIVRNNCYVIAKDQRHATTAMQYNYSLLEHIKHAYVNVTEQ